MSICSLCVHKDACQAWVRHGEILYGDFENDTDNCPYFTNSYDFVRVVRCEECVYYKKHPTSDRVKLCTNHDWNTEYTPFTKYDGFCYRGERKNNG